MPEQGRKGAWAAASPRDRFRGQMLDDFAASTGGDDGKRHSDKESR